ncbi:MAG: S-layer homology domain-containing protein [Cyanobacteria bacterium J06627_28]
MTQSPSGPPNDPRRDPRPSTPPATGATKPLSFDEMVALFVAFLSLGGVLVWGLTRGQMNFLDGATTPPGPAITSTEGESEAEIFTTAEGGTSADYTASAQANSASVDSATVDSATVDTEDAPATAEVSARSARQQLAEQAQARRDRIAAGTPIAEDIQDGVVGAIAGVTGAAATSEGALSETPTDAEAAEATEDAVSSDTGETAPGSAVPSEAASADPASEAIAFADVSDDYWAKPYIDALSSRGLISGYEDGSFKPDDPVTRAQIANVVSRTFDLTVEAEDFPFSDVPDDNWAKDSISEVVQGGFMTGFPDDTFDPNAPVTRAQALTTLVTGLNVETPTNVQASIDRYTDANAIPQWANEKMAAATAGSFVVNYPNIAELNPTEPTTRAELSAMIYQALVRENVVEPVESEYVVKP